MLAPSGDPSGSSLSWPFPAQMRPHSSAHRPCVFKASDSISWPCFCHHVLLCLLLLLLLRPLVILPTYGHRAAPRIPPALLIPLSQEPKVFRSPQSRCGWRSLFHRPQEAGFREAGCVSAGQDESSPWPARNGCLGPSL